MKVSKIATPPPQDDEAERLSALARYDILDTPSDEAFDRITRLASKIFQTPIALISLVDKDRQWFKSRQGLDAAETPREVAFCAHAIRSDEVMVVEDTNLDPRFSKNPLVAEDPKIRFYAGAPLTTEEGHRLGTLCVIDRNPRKLDEQQAALLQDLAAMVMDEMELRRLAATDSLTGATNRRHFLDVAERERRRAMRYQTPLAVLMMDVDRFKTINDAYGHAVGDGVLKQVTAICQNVMREHDVIGRFGGEEFAVLLPQTDGTGAAQVAERVRRAAAATKAGTDKDQVPFTVSIGVAVWKPDDEDIQAAIARADAALYAAKEAGRNQIKVDGAT